MPQDDVDELAYAREVLSTEARAIAQVSERLGASFVQAVDILVGCCGRVVVLGVGKAGIIGQKISATLASTGTPSHWMHPTEARHGDLGRVVSEDVALMLSNSGESDEMILVLPSLKAIGVPIVAITGRRDSSLARHSDVVLELGPIQEACPLGLAPSASTTAMLALGDALALAALRRRNFTKEDYARYHPAGELGRKLLTVDRVMRIDDANPLVNANACMERVLRVMSETTGSPGAAVVVDDAGRLCGIITDGDIRRRLMRGDRAFLDATAGEVMTKRPKRVRRAALASEALRLMRDHKIDQLPVVDDEDRVVGIIDVQDLLDVDKVSL